MSSNNNNMFRFIFSFLFLCLSLRLSTSQESEKIFLDPLEKYSLSWTVNKATQSIDFDIKVETRGFIGFGLSSSGKMDAADIFIGGIDDFSGQVYFHDCHGIGRWPEIDDHNDWTVISSNQTATHTSMKISRLLNTCDSQDFHITEETTRLIWSYGQTDAIGYHLDKRGTVSVTILGPPLPAVNTTEYERWDILVETPPRASQQDTLYWRTYHRGPPVDKKVHIVGYEAVLPTSSAKKHTHHFSARRCVVPPDVDADELFGPLVGTEGGECYVNPDSPSRYCQAEYLLAWSVGGKITLYPEDVGFPVDTGEYYVFDIHYDNPDEEDIEPFHSGISILYTSENLREKEAGLMVIGQDITDSLTIPGNVTDFVVTGHCDSECSKNIQESGISVFITLLHSHISGRKLKLRHFRNGIELPWPAFDNNYDFDFQQNKLLSEEFKILPGDSLAYECTYDSTWNDGKIVIGGYASSEEMCQVFLHYYPRTDLFACGSIYPRRQGWQDLGIVMNETSGTIISPANMAGLDYETALNTKFIWTDEIKNDIQQKRRFGDHEIMCLSNSGENIGSGMTKYPNIANEYEPEDSCGEKNGPSNANKIFSNLFFMTFTFITLALSICK